MAASPTDLPSIPLLTTKLFVPRPRADLVVRRRLLARLAQDGDGRRCTLLTAPAGAGKTTLLAAWLAARDRPAAWLSLDERDQDLHRFVRYLVAAFRTGAPACGTTALAWLDAPDVDVEAVLTSLLNDVAALPHDTLLVLDDYHLVRSPAVHDAAAFLLERLPPTTQLVISTREDPPLPMARLRGRGELVELRAADLGFTADEAADLLVGSMRLPLSPAQVGALVTRTEGWAAGLQLAGLAVRSRSDVAAFVTAFAGSHRLVADYLGAEVLDRQPAHLQRFLLATSVLDRMCAPLCDAVLGETGSQRMLEDLERANLFLVPLDDERTWFRYHHLFAQVLRARLGRSDAGAATVHRRAAAWFGTAGLLPEAIDHALAADDVDDAAARIASAVPTMLARYEIQHAMAGWLDALPDAVVRARTMLCLARAWLAVLAPRLDEAAAWVAAAERVVPTGPQGRRLRGAASTLRALILVFPPGTAPDAARDLAEQALADLAPDDVGFRVVAGVVLGEAALAGRRPDQAEEAVAAAVASGRAAGLRQATLVSWSHLAAVRRLRGAHRAALAAVRSALAWAVEQGSTANHAAAMLSAQLTSLLVDGDDIAAARPVAEEALRVLQPLGHVQLPGLLTRLAVARLRLADGDPEAAMALLGEARTASAAAGGLQVLVTAAEAPVRVARGDVDTAVRWASSVAPLELPSPLGLQTHLFAAAVEALGETPATVLVGHGLATGDPAVLRAAATRVEHLRRLGKEFGLGALEGTALRLEALTADALGDRPTALAALDGAVARCVPEGVVRPFVDAGTPMLVLLRAARERAAAGSDAAARLDALLAACAPPPARPPRNGLVEALTLREHEVLRLLAGGRSNAEIARTLVVEQSTVKTHLLHVYRKLAVRSRTQALAKARDLRLVD